VNRQELYGSGLFTDFFRRFICADVLPVRFDFMAVGANSNF
jgi:hypothetical protein